MAEPAAKYTSAMALPSIDLGHMAYEPCVEFQRAVLEKVAVGEVRSTLILVEHDPVLTLGANFHAENLLLTESELATKGIRVVKTDRGGDVTYHGPGQLVIYPIFDVSKLGKDLHRWLRELEEAMILTLESFGLKGERLAVNTGVWIDERKIAAIGIRVRRWVSMHGIALNCDVDLSPYQTIVPCGVRGYGVTSLAQELGRQVSIEEAKPVVIEAFETVFGSRNVL